MFIGPADLAASLDHAGELGHPKVKMIIEDAIRRMRTCGKPTGILTPDATFAARCIEFGTIFTTVRVDAGIRARATQALADAVP